MNTKFSKLFATVLIAAMTLGFVSIIVIPNAHAQSTPPAPSYWIDPSSETFYTTNTPIGTLFNVTVWASCLNGTASWSVQVGFNASQLQVVTAGFTDVSKSMLFSSLSSTAPLGPNIDNVGNIAGYPGEGSVEISESAIGTDYVPATTASCCYITFNVTAAPKSGNLTSLIDPAFGELPAVGETLYLLQSPTTAYPSSEIDNVTTAPCTYTLAHASTTPPTISGVTQVPNINSVNDSEQVSVTANITDNSGTGLYNATLLYSTDNATWTYVAMQLNTTSGLYGANVTGYSAGTTVYYEIQAVDNAGNVATQYITSYTVIPEFPNVALLVIMMTVVLASVVLITRKKRGR